MFGFGKKKDSETIPDMPSFVSKDLQEIQQAVESHPIFPTLSTEAEQFPQKQTQPQIRQQSQQQNFPKTTSFAQPMQRVKDEDREAQSNEEMQAEQRQYAPLFVKIDRYRNILNALGQVRTAMVMIHNSFNALTQLENARAETLKVLEKALERVEKKIANLDSELVKPAGYAAQMPTEEYADAATIETTIADLRGQIEQLKAELDQLG